MTQCYKLFHAKRKGFVMLEYTLHHSDCNLSEALVAATLLFPARLSVCACFYQITPVHHVPVCVCTNSHTPQ